MKALTPRRRVMVGVVSVMMAVVLAAFDSVRISQAWRLTGRTAVSATVWGVLSMVATTAFIIWAGKRGAWTRRGLVWRAYRSVLGVGAIALILAFGTTHPRRGSDQLTSNLAVGVTTYTAAVICLLFLSGGLRMLRPHTSRRLVPRDAAVSGHQAPTLQTHDVDDPHHQAEVWHVHLDRDEPDYYIAHCDCDWVGTAYDKSEPDSEQSARREASSHTTSVAQLLVEI